MKRHLLLIAILFCSIFSTAQVVYNGNLNFYNQASVDGFLTMYPNCTEINGSVTLLPQNGNPVLNLNGLQNITKITGSLSVDQHNSLVSTLNGLNNLNHIGGDIYISDTWMSNISGLQNVTYVGGSVEITSNHISDFSPLNNITYIGGNLTLSNDNTISSTLALQVTHIAGNLTYRLGQTVNPNLNPLSSLVSVGGEFHISVENITSMQGLGSLTTVGGLLYVDTCHALTSLNGLTSLTNIGGLSLDYNTNLINITGLSQITTLNQGLFIGVNGSLNSLTGLNNLNLISYKLVIQGNNNLTSINALSGASINTITELNISNNPNLSLCQELNVCNYLFGGGTYNIQNNGLGCNDFNQLIESCNLRWKNLIKGSLKFDFENDGCGVNDLAMDNVMVKATSGANVYSTFTNSNGEYRMFVPPGNYVVQSTSNLSNYTLTPLSAVASFPGVGGEQAINFCGTANQAINDVKVTFFATPRPPRPGFDVYYKVIYTNSGTTIMNGSVTFTFDGTKMNFVNSDVPIQSQNGTTLTWNYTNLYPFESREIDVKFNVLTPPTVNGEDHIYLTSTINPTVGDSTPNNNTFSFNNLVVNSYDPNDKTVLQGDTVLVENLGEYLNYVVRFQNTGSASAINIRIEDVLQNKLDPSTFQLIDLSHPGRVQLKNNIVEFIFDDINLPDSTSDEPNSHGYVSFKIKPMNAVFGNTIQNNASIFFDFNAPIITNTASIFVNKDTDSDSILDTVDNCKTISNVDQADADNDGIGDVCDDGLEVNPPYAIGFDTTTLDPLWKTYSQNATYTNVTVNNMYDVNNSGKTIKLFSYYSMYKAMLISPRLNNLSTSSTITFWMKEEGSSTNPIEIGFMTDPNNPATFTRLKYAGAGYAMALYTLDLSGYNPSFGKNLAILVKGRTIYIDDFTYTNAALSTDENEMSTFKLYPNPVSNVLTIENNEPFDSIKIYDINGRILKTISSSNEKQLPIDVNDLTQGMYFIEIQSGSKKHNQKFIKK